MKRVIPLIAALVLAGCTVGPDYRRPALATPELYAESATPGGPTDAELAGWWTKFGDARLSALVNRALAQNLDVELAAARIREARAREVVAGASALPQVDATASVTRQRISDNAIPAPPGGDGGTSFGLPGAEFTTWRAGFDASWELDLFGRNRREREAARGRSEAAVWNRRDVQLSVAAEVAAAYLTLRTLQRRMATAEAEVARQQRALDLVDARVRGGLVSGQDLAQQSSELASAKAAIPPLRAQAAVQIHKIGVLAGASPEALIADLSPDGAIVPSLPQVPAGLPSDLLRRRPDIRSAERELAASTADIGVATADLFPRFSLPAAPALVSTALASLLEWGSRSFSVAAAVDWPIFNGGRTRGTIAVANARQGQALVAYRKSVLTALQDVEDSLSRTAGDRDQLAKLEAALGSAERAEQLARTRYRGGLITLSDVLVAQGRRLSLENQVIETRGVLERDTVGLFKALGGGWPELAQAGAQP